MAPLILIIVSAVVISYPWASKLVFKMAGSQLSLPSRPPGPGGLSNGRGRPQASLQLEGLDKMLGNVQKRAGEWKTISFQLPVAANKTIAFSVDGGWGGQPQLRSTITADKSREIVPTNNSKIWIGAARRLDALFTPANTMDWPDH
jgi:hypothetical protein